MSVVKRIHITRQGNIPYYCLRIGKFKLHLGPARDPDVENLVHTLWRLTVGQVLARKKWLKRQVEMLATKRRAKARYVSLSPISYPNSGLPWWFLELRFPAGQAGQGRSRKYSHKQWVGPEGDPDTELLVSQFWEPIRQRDAQALVALLPIVRAHRASLHNNHMLARRLETARIQTEDRFLPGESASRLLQKAQRVNPGREERHQVTWLTAKDIARFLLSQSHRRAAEEAWWVWHDLVSEGLMEPEWSPAARRGVYRVRNKFSSNGHHADTSTPTASFTETILNGDAMLIGTALCTRILNPARLDPKNPTHLQGLADALRMNLGLTVPAVLAEQIAAQTAA